MCECVARCARNSRDLHLNVPNYAIVYCGLRTLHPCARPVHLKNSLRTSIVMQATLGLLQRSSRKVREWVVRSVSHVKDTFPPDKLGPDLCFFRTYATRSTTAASITMRNCICNCSVHFSPRHQFPIRPREVSNVKIAKCCRVCCGVPCNH